MSTNNQIQTGTTPLSFTQGGTGLGSISANSLLYASSSNVLSALSSINNGILGTNGSGVPSFSASIPTALFQSSTNTSWTPADASGASLTLTINQATYTQIGNIIIFQCSVTYPSTANSSGMALSGLPATANGEYVVFATISTSLGVGLCGVITNGSSNVSAYSFTAAASITNANCSTKTVRISGVYCT